MNEHDVIKSQKIADVAAVAVEDKLTVPKLFQLESIEKFKGAEDDTVNVKVEGVLPFRSYGWRNDRSEPIKFDDYKERKYAVKFGGDVYNGVRLTDEQRDMDIDGWTKLVGKQADAIVRGLNHGAVRALRAAPFEVVVQLDESNLKRSIIKLRQVMNKLNVVGNRTLVVESDLEAALLDDDKLSLASHIGDAGAQSALADASLGRRYGFDFVVADELQDFSVAMVESGFIFLNAAPGVPTSLKEGATTSYEGINMTWLKDYDLEYRRDRSVLNTYKGFDYIKDPLIGTRPDTDQSYVSEKEHFVRAVRVELGSSFSVDIDDTELAAITGIKDEGTVEGAIVAP